MKKESPNELERSSKSAQDPSVGREDSMPKQEKDLMDVAFGDENLEISDVSDISMPPDQEPQAEEDADEEYN